MVRVFILLGSIYFPLEMVVEYLYRNLLSQRDDSPSNWLVTLLMKNKVVFIDIYNILVHLITSWREDANEESYHLLVLYLNDIYGYEMVLLVIA